MTAAVFLRAARHSARITQSELSAKSHRAQPAISAIESGSRAPRTDNLIELLRHVGHRLISVPIQGTSTAEAGEQIASALLDGNHDGALRAFIRLSDNLHRAHGFDRLTIGLQEPIPTGFAEWDAALAGLVEHWLTLDKLPLPTWVTDTSRFLNTEAAPLATVWDVEPNPDSVPLAFRRRNVLIENETLASV